MLLWIFQTRKNRPADFRLRLLTTVLFCRISTALPTLIKAETDYFANQGYIVLKPDYRGNANSDVTNTALMRFAYPIDVLTLLTSLSNIPQANPNEIYIYGHSMGGEITLKVLEIASKNPQLLAKIKSGRGLGAGH